MVEQTARIQDAVVSFDTEPLILVDSQDKVLGYASKDECHDGDGQLHRAFSLFIFNDSGELLLQRRSDQKRLWPNYWSNSCCSHPRQGEEMFEAAHRRLYEELGLRTQLQYLYKFEYQASFGDPGTEHELCSVFIGKSSGNVQVNINEISEWRWVSPADLELEMADHPEQFTPWMKMEWAELTGRYRQSLDRLLGA